MFSNTIKELAKYINDTPGLNLSAYISQHTCQFQQLRVETTFLSSTAPTRQRLWHVLHNTTNIPKCKICGTEVKWSIEWKEYRSYCSSICGVNDQITITKRKKTNLIRYGVEHSSKAPSVKEKQKQTFLAKYGSHPRKLKTVQQKQIQTMMQNKHPVDIIEKLTDREWFEENYKVPLRKLAELLNIDASTVGTYFKRHGVEKSTVPYSIGQQEIANFLETLSIHTQTNNRSVIAPYELDIFLPDHNFAIEYCGLFWHADIHLEREYHQKKLERCEQKGINLLTIFEDEWIYKRDLVKRIILHKLGFTKERIYARKTTPCVVRTKTKNKFFDEHHIQGSGPGSINLGLLYDNNLVASASFINHNDYYDLNRYATSVHVVGGFGKILSFFATLYPSKPIITYADRRWNQGNLYRATNFKEVSRTRPIYEYVEGDRRVHRRSYARKHLPNRLQHFDPNLTEFQNCNREGILRVWNCGLIKFILEPKENK